MRTCITYLYRRTCHRYCTCYCSQVRYRVIIHIILPIPDIPLQQNNASYRTYKWTPGWQRGLQCFMWSQRVFQVCHIKCNWRVLLWLNKISAAWPCAFHWRPYSFTCRQNCSMQESVVWKLVYTFKCDDQNLEYDNNNILITNSESTSDRSAFAETIILKQNRRWVIQSLLHDNYILTRNRLKSWHGSSHIE